MSDLAGAWIFYSVLPAWPWPSPRFQRIARFASWIGLVIGALQALLCWGLLQLGWTMSGAAPMVIALGIWLSGGLHHDGVMDTADGLAAGPERCLEAMEDSRVGASGVLALVMVLMLQLGALIQLGQAAPAALVTVGVWSRVAPLWAMARFLYLRRDGTAGFHRRHGRPRRATDLGGAALLPWRAGRAMRPWRTLALGELGARWPRDAPRSHAPSRVGAFQAAPPLSAPSRLPH